MPTAATPIFLPARCWTSLMAGALGLLTSAKNGSRAVETSMRTFLPCAAACTTRSIGVAIQSMLLLKSAFMA